jgi:hypothetical protein
MALFFAAHTTACLTKQALRKLMHDLLNPAEPAATVPAATVKVRRAVVSQLAGRMLTEADAPDQATLEKWFAARLVNCEWVMRIDLDAQGDTVTEY